MYQLATLVVLLSLGAMGCASTEYARVRKVPKDPLVEQIKFQAESPATDRTLQVLRQYDLTGELHGDPSKLLADLQAIIERDPSAEKLYSFAELSYRAGKKMQARDQQAALDFYGAAVAYSYLYLFDQRFSHLRNPYDPQFRGACQLYNGALENTLRLVQKQGGLLPGRSHPIDTATQKFDISVVVRSNAWTDEDFDEFKFVSDYEVNGLANQFQTYGLGVPLIAVRKRPEQEDAADKYYPQNLAFAVTAFLRLVPDENCDQWRPGRRHRALLELYDPLVTSEVAVGEQRVPLESDLSTPLAYFLNLNNKQLDISTYGLLRPDREQAVTGLYMLEPYRPGKIPVVMVHGLWSSPLTWTEMFNDLRSVPEIRDHYQIWYYMYPSGQPFWTSATRMRQELARMRDVFDPEHREPALDQMVLVGHSMGGLVSKLQSIDSRDDVWHLESDQPFGVVKASYEERERLEQLFFFKANPSVSRVVTIATPHRGSKFANDTTRYLAQKMISLPGVLAKEQVVRDNPGLFRDTTLVSVKTSLDSLSPTSPILPVMLEAERPAWVKYHNIVGIIPDKGLLGRLAKNSDGVVAFDSAHLADAASEIIVSADHSNVHRHPLAVLEVRRILLEHLHDLRTTGGEGPATPSAIEQIQFAPAATQSATVGSSN
ncbi:MAG TPA: alpha/beta fold hydrolase [Pirellulales bacterium]|jgi:pimeloyl-ACP methyl ester carboxylesterase|nr:alpha/beta fold hydrolase [Pirellulales bacterium]